MEHWVTAEEVVAAKNRMRDAIDGFVQPMTYSVARRDGDRLTFAYVNEVGGMHELPAVCLATVVGYVRGNITVGMSYDELKRAIELLAPAEACEAFDHPNLWSWRPLLEASSTADTFVAVFVEDMALPPGSEEEAGLRGYLTPPK